MTTTSPPPLKLVYSRTTAPPWSTPPENSTGLPPRLPPLPSGPNISPLAQKVSRLSTRAAAKLEKVVDGLLAVDVGRVTVGRLDSAMPRRSPKAEPAAPRLAWPKRLVPLVNPRPPSVPEALIPNLEAYYTACAVMGYICAQHEEPDHDAGAEWCADFGERVAKEVRKRWG